MTSRPALTDSIAAVATPPGLGGVGVVRISGPDLNELCIAITGLELSPRRATRAVFRDARGQAIDDGLALYFRAPHSYTGEDVLELQGHGGPVVMQMLLARCTELGARLAEPGEFTRRAFLNDKLDLAQAEAVADLIAASTASAARLAMRSLHGEFSRVIDDLVTQLTELRMLIEATLDFPEEEIDPLDRADARGRLARLRNAVERALEQGEQGSILRNGLTVVLAGQPNVGKSSLLNRLAGEELAIVTPVPGTTRDAVRQTIQLEGIPISIVDTAGLRETGDEVERIGIARTWREIERADVLLLLVDAAVGVGAADDTVLAGSGDHRKRLIVHNKVDLLGIAPRIERTAGATTVFLSAKTGAGIDLLQEALLEIAGWHPVGEDIYMARERHLVALRAARAFLLSAEREFIRTELFAEELRLAQQVLGSITGVLTADDLLGEIFSRFCIGK